jgi:multidrug efflux pump subunit AcrB
LQQAALDVEKDLRTVAGLGSIASSASLVRPEISVRPDFARAADLGVSSASIAQTLRVATLGDYEAQLPKLNVSQRQVPIVVQLQESARQDLSLLERLMVPGSRGPVMLGQVASLQMTGGPAVIDRYDRQRNVNFEIELSDLPLGEVTQAVKQLPSVRNLPAGVRVVEVGDAEVMGELFASFGVAMAVGIFVHLRGAGVVVPGVLASSDDSGRLALIPGRRVRGLVAGGQEFFHALAHWSDHVDGRGHQELDPAG